MKLAKIIIGSIILFLGIFVIKTVIAGILIIGSWSLSISSADLITGAGSDINNSFVSISNQVMIDITDINTFENNWRIDVHKTDVIWDTNIQLFIARTGEGNGNEKSTISGGLSYQNITDIEQLFFAGRGQRIGVPIQLKFEGITIRLPIGSYSTTIVYTITEF